MDSTAALLIVNVQNDFCPGGALQIPDGDRIIEPLNRAIGHFSADGRPVLVCRDWHSTTTMHFRNCGGVWPSHCIQGTPGADFHPRLLLPESAVVLSKGINPVLDGYSAFEGIAMDGRMLAELLRDLQVRTLWIGGLATDYCVLCTTLEALRNGYKVTVLTDAVVGIDIVPGESISAIEDMVAAGATLSTVDNLIAVAGGKSSE